jgi:DNA mismatch repair protein MutS
MDKLSVMDQYLSLKKEAGSRLLFFQMGDFYELFYEDAKKTAHLLGLTLTQRGTDKDGNPIPMCGIPIHAANNYLSRLLSHNEQIAICNQTEDVNEAKNKRGYKAIVERKIIRIVTPATILEDELIQNQNNNFLVSIGYQKESLALAWTDISTGDCFSSQNHHISGTLSSINPKEILLPESLLAKKSVMETLAPWKNLIQPWKDSQFQTQKIEKHLLKIFNVPSLSIIGNPSPPMLMALGMMCNYVLGNVKDNTLFLKTPQSIDAQNYMNLGGMIHQHLELTSSSLNTTKGSVLHAIARTKTPQGYRLLARRLTSPLCQKKLILERQQQVSWSIEHQNFLASLQEKLSELQDLERTLARIAHGRGHARELNTILTSLNILLAIQQKIRLEAQNNLSPPPPLFDPSFAISQKILSLHDHLQRALVQPLPLKISEGGIIRQGYTSDIDALRNTAAEQQRTLNALELSYKTSTGIESLRIKNNQANGFFIELHPRFAPKIPEDFIHKQNLSNAVRYTTKDLQELDLSINAVSQNLVNLEENIIQKLITLSQENLTELYDISQRFSEWDWAASMAQIAIEKNYVKPEIADQGPLFEITDGRHPVLEHICQSQDSVFTANSCHLHQKDKIWLLTGPNMAGKSTFLRQNALIAILAQNGSFVPAKKAKMSILHGLFSRLGANDDISQGQSTFMVEMLDVATILHQADAHSLIILDEVGRGTATYDGLAIAQASLEYLHNHIGAMCIFASHYHELNTLHTSLPLISNHTMKVEEHKGQVVFLHHVINGTSNRSYGIHVAALAGLPQTVIARASEILRLLENKNHVNTLPLFAHPESSTPITTPETPPIETQKTQPSYEHVIQEILKINTNDISPRQALDLIDSLQELIKTDPHEPSSLS